MIQEGEIQELFRHYRSGRFEIRKTLGVGGMGVVVQAYDKELEVLRAIKIFNPELLAHESLVRRFKNEARIMSGIDHPNIVRVFDSDKIDLYHFIVLEWIDGGSLSGILAHSGAMRSRVALEMIFRVCDALTFAHKRGIIHRDIKPDNILITKEGVPKVTDFGIAHMEDDQKKRLTSTGEAMGTEGYASPQQLSNFAQTDVRDDVYSVAVTLWALMTGLRPPSILFFHDIESRADMLETIPSCLHPIFKKATAYSSSDRYQTMDAFASALRAVEEDLPPLSDEASLSVSDDEEIGFPEPTSLGATRVGVKKSSDAVPEPTRVSRPAPSEPSPEPTSVSHKTPVPQRDDHTLAYRPSGEVVSERVPPIELVPDAPPMQEKIETVAEQPRRRVLFKTLIVLAVIGVSMFAWFQMRSGEVTKEPSMVLEPKMPTGESPDVLQTTVDTSAFPEVSTPIDVTAQDSMAHTETDVPVEVIQVPVEPVVEKKEIKKEKRKEDLKPEGKSKETPKLASVEPTQPKLETAKVQVGLKIPSDDSVRVWLVGPGGKHKLPGSVAPGTYKVVAIFKDQDTETVVFPKYEVLEGTTPRLSCDSAREVCQKL